MKIPFKILFILLIATSISCNQKEEFTITNDTLSRTIRIEDGKLRTVSLFNKIAEKTIIPQNDVEFKLRISEGTDIVGSDVELNSNDFDFVKVLKDESSELAFLLENITQGLEVEVHYVLESNNSYMNKYLSVRSEKPITLERIDIESISLEDIYQPYQMKQITAWGPSKWRPGLGQPLFTLESASFWGLEFPASYNFVDGKTANCGYLWGKEIKANETYTTYKSVFGVGDDPEYIQDTFFDYIDQKRIRPLRLQIQYNSWFDFWSKVNKDSFSKSVDKIHQELNKERNVDPLQAYVIDDGWQNSHIDWSDKAWKVNDKFDADFSTSFKNVKAAGSNLGLWLSPGCNFGARPAVKIMREKGLEALDEYMSLAGPKYMQLLEDRMLELTTQGVSYFKLDGLFGHLNRREFDFNGKEYGVPTMPQVDTKGFALADERLNDSKYDELKTYYLVAGTERLMEIFEKQHKVNPDVYIVISNGAYLSPWWLMYTDAVWMINAGDAAGGSDRTQELVYRDGVYYDTWVKEKTQFPINSIFNHEPKKTKTGESVKQFSEYLWMNLSRGTGFVELYIITQNLSESDWDVLADGLKWVKKVFPYFKRSRMHGGNPNENQVYGYSGWNKDGGYASFHNPSDKTQTYTFELNRAFGLVTKGTYTLSSPLPNASEIAGKTFASGNRIELTIEPGEVKILEFNKTN